MRSKNENYKALPILLYFQPGWRHPRWRVLGKKLKQKAIIPDRSERIVKGSPKPKQYIARNDGILDRDHRFWL